MGKREYCPYLDANMMSKEKWRNKQVKVNMKDETKVTNRNSEDKRGYMTAKQIRDLDSGSEPGTLDCQIKILKIAKAEKDRIIREQNTVGVNFHDPYGFGDGFKEERCDDTIIPNRR